jgi:hypothetical protein
MGWLFSVLPFLFFGFVVISIIRSALQVARKLGEAQPGAGARTPANYDPAEAERTRRIQEEIRRKIAERRGMVMPVEPAPPAEPVVAVTTREEPPALGSIAAVLERQQQLVDQMQALEAARLMEQRKAAIMAATVQDETARAAAVVAMRGALLADLRKPATARRAVLLREVLDRPVALR